MAKKKPKLPRTTKPKTREPYLVFVSHATADKFIAKVICQKIEEIGAEFFRDDRDIQGGDDIPERIREHIEECDEFLIILSPQSIGRQWVLVELGAAWFSGKRIVPICYHIDMQALPDLIKLKKA